MELLLVYHMLFLRIFKTICISEVIELADIVAPEIAEMDINPLMGTMKNIAAVDTRIRIEK